MSRRRLIFTGCLIMVILGVAAGITRSPKSASPPLPLPRDISDLHPSGPGGKLAINEDNNTLCYTLEAFGQKRHGTIVGADFHALRASGQEAVINHIYLNHIREEIKALNSAVSVNQALPLDGSAAFAQMYQDGGGGAGCGYWTLTGFINNTVSPPECDCDMEYHQCNLTWWTCETGAPHCPGS
jgi:hypothetical protein